MTKQSRDDIARRLLKLSRIRRIQKLHPEYSLSEIKRLYECRAFAFNPFKPKPQAPDQ